MHKPVTKPSNRAKLRSLMELYELQPMDVAGMLDRSVATVNSWRSVSHIDIPDNLLTLLEYKLIDRYGSRS